MSFRHFGPELFVATQRELEGVVVRPGFRREGRQPAARVRAGGGERRHVVDDRAIDGDLAAGDLVVAVLDAPLSKEEEADPIAGPGS